MAASDFYKAYLNHSSIYGVVVTAIIHLLAIVIFMNLHNVTPFEIEPQKLLQMTELKAKSNEAEKELPLPSVSIESKSTEMKLPVLDFRESEHLDVKDNFLSEMPYELPDKKAEQYKNIFDPRLRKKLVEAQSLNPHATSVKPEGWTELDGRDFIEHGDGVCGVSMQNIDAHSHAKNWGLTRCGTTDSEKSMDRAIADYESHKNTRK